MSFASHQSVGVPCGCAKTTGLDSNPLEAYGVSWVVGEALVPKSEGPHVLTPAPSTVSPLPVSSVSHNNDVLNMLSSWLLMVLPRPCHSFSICQKGLESDLPHRAVRGYSKLIRLSPLTECLTQSPSSLSPYLWFILLLLRTRTLHRRLFSDTLLRDGEGPWVWLQTAAESGDEAHVFKDKRPHSLTPSGVTRDCPLFAPLKTKHLICSSRRKVTFKQWERM